MNIDYEKLGEVLDKFVLNWPHGGTHDDHMVCCETAAKEVIKASGLLEEVERLQAKVRRVEDMADEAIKNGACMSDYYGEHFTVVWGKKIKAVLKGEE